MFFPDSALQWAICHEMGHTLGLDHSTVPGAVMYKQHDVDTWNQKLDQDDINGISFLYPKGRPSGYYSIAERPLRIGSRQQQNTQSPRPANNWPTANSQQPMAWQPNLRSPTTYRLITRFPPQNDVRQSTRAPRYAPPGHIPNYRPRSRPRSRWWTDTARNDLYIISWATLLMIMGHFDPTSISWSQVLYRTFFGYLCFYKL